MTSTSRRVAVITVVHGRAEHLARQREALARWSPGVVHIVVRVDDAMEVSDLGLRTMVVDEPTRPEGLPLARARNRGVAEAIRRDAQLLILLDVDCIPGPALVHTYGAAADRHPGAVLCGPVTYLPPPGPDGYLLDAVIRAVDPHPARPAPLPGIIEIDPDGHQLFWSLSFAVTAETWRRIGGFDEAYAGYGGEDTDFGQRARRAAIDLAWVGGADAFHQHHPVSRPPVEHLDDILRNGRLFADQWGWWPMEGWLQDFAERGLVQQRADGWVRVESASLTSS